MLDRTPRRYPFRADEDADRLAARFASMLDSISDAFVLLDDGWRVVFLNRRAESLLRVSQDELLGRVVWDAFQPAMETDIYPALHRAKVEGQPTELVSYYAPLESWFDIRAYPSDDGLAVYFRDVSEQRHAEARLRENEARFRAVAQATTDVVWDLNLVDSTLWWSDGMQTVFGYPPSEVGPGLDSWEARLHPDDRARVVEGLEAAVLRRDPYWEDEYRFFHHDGRVLDIVDRGYMIFDERGEPLRLVGGMLDVTARKQAEQKLAQQAALLNEAHDAIVVLGVDHRIQFWNRGAESTYGWNAAEAVGRSIVDLLYVADAAEFLSATAAVLKSGRWRGRIRQQRNDGTVIIVEGNWTLLRDALGEPVSILAIDTDISERLALEEQLRQAQRLEAVGQLTGGVAHDFNNLLQVILGNAEALAEELAADSKLRLLAELTKKAAERGADLTGRLLAFARQQALEPQAVDVARLLSGMDDLLRRTLGEHIEIEIVRGGGLWLALVDAAQLESAILNLCINARDAMLGGGRLTIELANAHLDQHYAEQQGDVVAGQYVLVAVSDTGSGMSPEVAAHAFEPFFTTKPVGKGSGLGLSMAFGFAKQSRGHMKIYSEVGQGTTVKLYLPRVERSVTLSVSRPASGESLGAGERILVVEDDDLVREHVMGQLRALGYCVVGAGDCTQALAVLEHDDGIDLLFTDVVLPGALNGRQLAEEARKLRPDMPVLFTSGYTENAIVHHGRLDPGVLLLNKPYRRQDLAAKVRQALATRPRGAATETTR